MPPRINLLAAKSALRQTTAPRHSLTSLPVRTVAAQPSIHIQRRWNSSDEKKKLEEEKHAAEPLPHVSEEAREINKIMDKEKWCDGAPSSPELEQGTPVSEILSRDKEAQKHAPKVFQNQVKKGPASSRSFSTSSRLGQLESQSQNLPEGDPASDAVSAALVQSMIEQATQHAEGLTQPDLDPGLKFPAPETLPKSENYRTRYEPLLEQFTKLMMRDGKLAIAQKNMSQILDHLRSSPPPKETNPKRRLQPGTLPPPQLPLNPIAYLTAIVDSVSPLLKIKQVKGQAGGGASLQVPTPLYERQRRRTAIRWIIDASDKRRDTKFAARVANELVAVAEGRSGVWEKKEALHRAGLTNRVSLMVTGFKKR
ncbi:ribosomal protein S7 domain-containing protein [Aspergillus karnatakaensis]|uniref:mitochondrial 37S ribosomal protein uS7m n=1 Tax=Aspergillus karnatakaensis TaxID=1810916 RepID=UPI003CCDE8A9